MTRVVPYLGSVKRGDSSAAVPPLKRAESRAGYLKWEGTKFTRSYGRFAEAGLKRFQHDEGLPATGVYDQRTHSRLAPFYDAYAISLLLQAREQTKEGRLRAGIVAQGMALYNRRYMIRYDQWRPNQLWDAEHITRLDCSGMCKAVYRLAGGPQLDNDSWSWGNTDTMIRFGRLVTLVQAKPGDLVYYGFGSDPNHMALYVGDGRVLSMGHYPMSVYEIDYNRGSLGRRIAIRSYV